MKSSWDSNNLLNWWISLLKLLIVFFKALISFRWITNERRYTFKRLLKIKKRSFRSERKKTNTKNYLKVYSIIFTQQKRKNTINSNLQHHFLHFKYFVMQDWTNLFFLSFTTMTEGTILGKETKLSIVVWRNSAPYNFLNSLGGLKNLFGTNFQCLPTTH